MSKNSYCPKKSSKCRTGNCGKNSSKCKSNGCSKSSKSNGCECSKCKKECNCNLSKVCTAHAYLHDISGNDVIDGARFGFTSTLLGSCIELEGGPTVDDGSRLVIDQTGTYAFTFSVRGTTPTDEEGASAPIVVALGTGLAPTFTELLGTRFASLGSPTGGTQSVAGAGEVDLKCGDVVSLRNLSGSEITLANDEAIDATLSLQLIEAKPDCDCC